VKILFIEDEEALLAAGMEQMEFLGHSVYPAANLAEAQAILDDSSISLHCIIADRNLPDGDGVEFVKKAALTHPHCKSAIVSAFLTDEAKKDLKNEKISYFLKPLLYSTVITELRSQVAKGMKPVDTSVSEEYAEYQKKREAREKKRIESLHQGIDQTYEKFMRERKKLAIAISALVALIASILAGVIYTNFIFIGICFLVTFAAALFKLLKILTPSSRQREGSIELIHSAVNEPSRIKSFKNDHVCIVDASGNLVQLEGIEQKIWQSEVVPFFLASKLEAESSFKRKSRSEESSKVNEFRRRRAEILEKGASLEQERDRVRMNIESLQSADGAGAEPSKIDEKEKILKQREAEIQERMTQIEREARDLEARSSYVTEVENSLVERLNNLSEREAYLEQNEINGGILRDR
jgi:response regulator of citrate/malate metabolism